MKSGTWRTICGVKACLALRHSVASPNCAFVLRRGFLRRPFFGWEELADEWIVEARLPFLNECHFKTAVVDPVGVYWDGCPNIQIVMLFANNVEPTQLVQVVHW